MPRTGLQGQQKLPMKQELLNLLPDSGQIVALYLRLNPEDVLKIKRKAFLKKFERHFLEKNVS